MTNTTNIPTEDEAREAWNKRLNRHSSGLVEAALEAANREVSYARGLNPSDYFGHGEEGRTAWYLAAARYVDEHCPGCAQVPAAPLPPLSLETSFVDEFTPAVRRVVEEEC